MSYKVSEGISEDELSGWLKDAAKKYGTFRDGRVNYKNSGIAPIVMITVTSNDEILLVKRGYGLADAEGYWSIVNGFIDEDRPVAEIAVKELKEEIGLQIKPRAIKVANSYTIKNHQEKRAYVVFPCLVKLDIKPKIVLDREHTDFTWTTRDKLNRFEMLDDTLKTIDAALALL